MTMVRQCEGCQQIIEQKEDEYLEMTLRVLNATESEDQDDKATAYGDFCDGCIREGRAVATLLKELDWKLEVSCELVPPGTSDPRD